MSSPPALALLLLAQGALQASAVALNLHAPRVEAPAAASSEAVVVADANATANATGIPLPKLGDLSKSSFFNPVEGEMEETKTMKAYAQVAVKHGQKFAEGFGKKLHEEHQERKEIRKAKKREAMRQAEEQAAAEKAVADAAAKEQREAEEAKAAAEKKAYDEEHKEINGAMKAYREKKEEHDTALATAAEAANQIEKLRADLAHEEKKAESLKAEKIKAEVEKAEKAKKVAEAELKHWTRELKHAGKMAVEDATGKEEALKAKAAAKEKRDAAAKTKAEAEENLARLLEEMAKDEVETETPPPQSGCAPWCAGDQRSWSEKCSFEGCKSCGTCVKGEVDTMRKADDEANVTEVEAENTSAEAAPAAPAPKKERSLKDIYGLDAEGEAGLKHLAQLSQGLKDVLQSFTGTQHFEAVGGMLQNSIRLRAFVNEMDDIATSLVANSTKGKDAMKEVLEDFKAEISEYEPEDKQSIMAEFKKFFAQQRQATWLSVNTLDNVIQRLSKAMNSKQGTIMHRFAQIALRPAYGTAKEVVASYFKLADETNYDHFCKKLKFVLRETTTRRTARNLNAQKELEDAAEPLRLYAEAVVKDPANKVFAQDSVVKFVKAFQTLYLNSQLSNNLIGTEMPKLALSNLGCQLFADDESDDYGTAEMTIKEPKKIEGIEEGIEDPFSN